MGRTGLRLTLLAALGAPLVAAGCGGKLLPMPGAGDDVSGGGDDGGGAGTGSGSMIRGSNDGSGSGSSSSSSSSSSGGGSYGGNGGPAATGSSVPPSNVCLSAKDCAPGLVCCGSVILNTYCLPGPCPTTAIGPIQLCASPAECLAAGSVCTPLSIAPETPITVCNPAPASSH